jgi:formylglycine-generating enzyme required for sulfatase activity
MGNTVYTATITLSPKVGYTLNGVALNNFVVAGAVVTPTANAGVITATFPSTPARKISQSLIPGVMAPVTGNSPVTTVGGSDQYTGVVNWSPTVVGTFTANTVYTANITLIPKDGYTLTGVGKNSFMVAGLDGDYIYLIHAANSGSLIVNYVVTASQVSTKIGNLMAIPAGRFQRDSSATNISVITQPYTMSQHEITRGQFMNMFLNNDPSNKVNSNGTSDPVQMVNWYHAIAFCNKLSLAEGLTPVYVVNGVNFNTLTFSNIPTIDDPLWNTVTANWTNNGYRLPTEMEWLWAAMGAPTDGQGTGINTTGYLKGYAGSIEGADHTQIASYAWYESNSSNRTHAVGGLDPNELGLYDMSGNVYEWCWDWSADYPVGTLTDYRCSVANTNRVIKGGGWSNASADFRLFIRSASNPYAQANSLGFRVVRL